MAKKCWQKSAILVTMMNVKMANALVLLQSDLPDHGTTDYALCPHHVLWHIAMFNSSASWKTKGQALMHKKAKSPEGLILVEGEDFAPLWFCPCQKSAPLNIMLSLEKVWAWLAKRMSASICLNCFLVVLHGSIAQPKSQKERTPAGTVAEIKDLVSRDVRPALAFAPELWDFQ